MSAATLPKFELDPVVVKVSAKDFSPEGSLTTKLPNSMTKRLVLVFFYANWCHNCTRTEPEYQKAARSLQNSNVILAAYDSVNAENSARMKTFTEFKLLGYPTCCLYYDGVYQDMLIGAKNQKEIENYMVSALAKYSNKTSIYSSSLI